MRKNSKPCAWYSLRRTLPLWSFEKNLNELISKLPEYKVDELIVKVDTEEFFHGQIPLDWLKAYQPKLFKVKKEMEKLGIVYSLNPWITHGHADRGRNAETQLPGIVTAVGSDGEECACCACSLSEVWQRNTIAAWKIYAETKPHIMWVEDDIRTFNHRPVNFGCFCDLHMQRFSKLVGEKVSRERLVGAITASGKPHPWRKLFFDIQGQIMIDTVSMLAKTVHSVSPETCLGLMSSGPENHCMEGRKWHDSANAMADGRLLYSRPPMGNYSESNLRDLAYCPHSIKITRYCMPEHTVEQTEVENFTFTQYSKSSIITFLQMAISFAYGSHGVTMNLFDHMGTPMELVPSYGKMLADKKPFLNALAQSMLGEGSFKGIRLLHNEKSSYCKELSEKSGYHELTEDGGTGALAVERLGIANDFNDSNVTFAFGQTLRAYPDETIKSMLSKGILLDAVAAGVLVERGFAEDIGLKSIEKPQKLYSIGPFSAEEYFNPKFGGHDKKFMTMILGRDYNPSVSLMQLMPGAEIISVLADADAEKHDPMFIAFENALGGRVVVTALDTRDAIGGFFNPYRLEQFHNIVCWLSRGKPELLVKPENGAYPMCWRKDCSNYTIAGVFNLSLDPWDKTVFTMAFNKIPRTIKRLNSSGRWTCLNNFRCELHEGILKIEYSGTVDFYEPLVLMLS